MIPPSPILAVLNKFQPLFSRPVWKNVVSLISGAILTRGKMTVTAVLRTLGLHNLNNFHKFHWIFSGAKWSGLACAKILLNMIQQLIPQDEPIIILFDETVEKRKGTKIKGIGYYRINSQSSKKKHSLSFGLKWLCAAITVKLPWSSRRWALPFLSTLTLPKNVLKSSKNLKEKNGNRRYKPFTQITMQMMSIIKKWLTQRKLLFCADGAFFTHAISAHSQKLGVPLIGRFRWNARLFEEPPLANKKRGRPRKVGQRIPDLKTLRDDPTTEWKQATVQWYYGTTKQIEYCSGVTLWYNRCDAPVKLRWVIVRGLDNSTNGIVLACTEWDESNMSVETIINTFVERWNIEVTFEEVKARVGMGTQRQWSDKAIERITPCILALYSLITLMGNEVYKEKGIKIESTAWYKKREATFSDVLASVRREIWRESFFYRFLKSMEPVKNNMIDSLSSVIEMLAEAS